MKFVINERIKHRLTGVIVLVSVAAIFVPAIMKKSNQHLDEKMSLSVKLPPKPQAPKVFVAGEKALFQSLKVAHVEIPSVNEVPRLTQTVRAEVLSTKSAVPSVAVAMEKSPARLKPNVAVAPAIKAVAIAAPAKLAKTIAFRKELYAVQLASFSQKSNARSLVLKLRSKGYKATYNKFMGKQGEYYKVTVGQLAQKNEAESLQKQLASQMQLNGFIIKTGIS